MRKIRDFFHQAVGCRPQVVGSREKEGRITIDKLILIVLAVVVLFVLGLFVPNIAYGFEDVEGRMNEVIGMLGFLWGDSGDGGECYSANVLDYGDGKKLLGDLGLEVKNGTMFWRCRGVCNMSMDGDDYRVSGGVFEVLAGEEWMAWDGLPEHGVGDMQRNWELYNKGAGLLGEGVFESGVSKQFSLVGDGNGYFDDVTSAYWQNGIWEVRVDKGDVEVFEDDNKAIDWFVEGANNGIFDDKVVWRFVETRVGVDEFLGEGRNIDELIFDFGRIYDSIVAAEHREHYDLIGMKFRGEYSPWIRTEYSGGLGSSAYGPLQLTKDLAKGYLNNDAIYWDKDERIYLIKFIEQGELFLKWGGTNMPADKKDPLTGEDVSRYDYGGSGDLTSAEDKKMYRQVAEKMLGEIYMRRDGKIDKVWREWRFGAGDMRQEDEDYADVFYDVWSRHSARDEWEHGDFGKVDSDGDVARLKAAFARLKEEALLGAEFSDEEIERLRLAVLGSKIEAGGTLFEVGVEKSDGRPVVTFVNGSLKLGLKQAGKERGMSILRFFIDGKPRQVQLKPFPVSLVEWKGGSWVEIGNDDYYRLYEKFFKEVKKAAAIGYFLKKRCR
jgi:hypothetical protein